MKTKNSVRLSLNVLGAIVALSFLAATSYGQSWSDGFASPATGTSSNLVKGDVKGGGLPVLLVIADQPDPHSELRDGLAALPEIGQVDTFDSTGGTPTLDQLLNYSCVVVWAVRSHFDPDALGNVLADYADSGGGVITSTPSRVVGGWWIGGRFLSDGYDPLTNGSGPLLP